MKSLMTTAALMLVSVATTGCTKTAFQFVGVEGTMNVPMGDRYTESFNQNKAQGEVDILIVSDNSGSMAAQQQKLGERFISFTQAFNQIDYQIGITTTDVDGSGSGSKGTLVPLVGANSKILKSSQAMAHQVFLNSVKVGTSGSGNEQAMMASMMAFEKRNSENAGFFRDNTDLAILILSDEDEMSTGNGTHAAEVIQQFKGIWGDSKRLMAFGIIVKPGDQSCFDQQVQDGGGNNSASYGTRANDLAGLTGGETFSICDDDYSESLSAISEKVRNLAFSITLSHKPLPQTLQVEFSSGENIGYRVVGDRIIFDRVPQQGTRIVVTYNVPG